MTEPDDARGELLALAMYLEDCRRSNDRPVLAAPEWNKIIGALHSTPVPQCEAELVADKLRKSCDATNGCSCADLDYQWYGPRCEAIMANVMRTMLRDSRATPPSPQIQGTAK